MTHKLALPVLSGGALKRYQDAALERIHRADDRARASLGKPRCIQNGARTAQEDAIALAEEFGALGKECC